MKLHTLRLKPGKEGQSFGGHLKEGTVIHLTAEIVICEDESVAYIRKLDKETGFPELVVKEMN